MEIRKYFEKGRNTKKFENPCIKSFSLHQVSLLKHEKKVFFLIPIRKTKTAAHLTIRKALYNYHYNITLWNPFWNKSAI